MQAVIKKMCGGQDAPDGMKTRVYKMEQEKALHRALKYIYEIPVA